MSTKCRTAVTDTLPHHPNPHEQLWLRVADIAIRWGCSEKTFRNQVSAGKLPRPTRLPIGPRWSLVLIESIEAGTWQPNVAEKPRRGRPRIAARKSGGAK